MQGEASTKVPAGAVARGAAKVIADHAERGLTREESARLSDSGLLAAAGLAQTPRTPGPARGSKAVWSVLFEVSGTRSARNSRNRCRCRHRHDARTRAQYDPARWKIQHIGRYVLNGTLPPRHGLL
ncbi:hypothetical protein ACIOKD_36700 [Streptomyces sp. NPDC087844]|uniref:hypothetical protein n=1 Tax=Streptomyces sp. NPDC087844 TaxID=3365805 RepID=UPI00382DDB24